MNNTGIIEARGVERTPDGRVFLSAGGRGGAAAGSVVNAGSIRAVNANRSGGSAYVTGEDITLASGSAIDVSAEYGDGGTALIGGAFQGAASHWQDADIEVIVPSARSVTMELGAAIHAEAAGIGDGGLAVLWSEGTTRFDGNISARGGDAGGDGGLVETSGRDLFVAGLVDTRAAAGKTGTYLLDPTNFTISSGSGGQTASGIGADTLVTNLGTSNVTLQTSAADNGTDKGDITVDAAVTWDSAYSLALLAHNDILVNANIQNAGVGGVTLVAGWDGTTTSQTKPGSLTDMTTAMWFGNTTNGDGSVIVTDAQAPNPASVLVKSLREVVFDCFKPLPPASPEAAVTTGRPCLAGAINSVQALDAALSTPGSDLDLAVRAALAGEFTWGELDKLLTAATNAARSYGWSLARAYAPEQELTGGYAWRLRDTDHKEDDRNKGFWHATVNIGF